MKQKSQNAWVQRARLEECIFKIDKLVRLDLVASGFENNKKKMDLFHDGIQKYFKLNLS